MAALRNVFPFLHWASSYKSSWLRGDITAGLTVGVILIPQGMAYAMLAGLPPIHGLYAATLPILLYALLGTSRQLAVGPVAMDSLLTATAIAPLAVSGTAEYIVLASLLALVVGCLQFAMGLFRLGFLVNFLSAPVVSGFTSAVALIIAVNQIPLLLGVDVSGTQFIHDILLSVAAGLNEANTITVVVGGASAAIIYGLKKLHKGIPGALIAIVLATASTWLFALSEHGLAVVGDIPSGLPMLSLPQFDMPMIETLFSTAAVIALISFTEAVAIGKALQAKHRTQEVMPNNELRAIGVANIGSSFVGGFPVTGGFSRSAVNDNAGANTPLASVISVVVVSLILLLLTDVFTMLPIATLAAIIFVSVLGLLRIREVHNLWRFDRVDLALMVATFCAVIFFGVMEGIGLGVLMSLALVVYRSSYPHIATLGRLPGTDQFRNVRRFDEVAPIPGAIIVRPDAPLFFANINALRDRLYREESKLKEPLRLVVIDASAISSLDSTAVQWLRVVAEYCSKRGITLMFSDVIGPVRDTMHAAGLFDDIGHDNLFLDTKSAVDAFEARSAGEEAQQHPGALQTGLVD